MRGPGKTGKQKRGEVIWIKKQNINSCKVKRNKYKRNDRNKEGKKRKGMKKMEKRIHSYLRWLSSGL
jgi:hypothetical protein